MSTDPPPVRPTCAAPLSEGTAVFSNWSKSITTTFTSRSFCKAYSTLMAPCNAATPNLRSARSANCLMYRWLCLYQPHQHCGIATVEGGTARPTKAVIHFKAQNCQAASCSCSTTWASGHSCLAIQVFGVYRGLRCAWPCSGAKRNRPAGLGCNVNPTRSGSPRCQAAGRLGL